MMATIAAATPAAAGLPAAAVGLPVLPPPPPDSAAEARSSRVKALLERTARLGERRGSSGGTAAAGIDDSLSAMSSRVSSPTLSDGPPPSLPWLPSLPRLPPGVSPSRASSSSRADEHMLRIVQARLASLSATRARVDRLLAAEQAELEAALQHLLAHARCRSSEHAAAAQMAAATASAEEPPKPAQAHALVESSEEEVDEEEGSAAGAVDEGPPQRPASSDGAAYRPASQSPEHCLVSAPAIP